MRGHKSGSRHFPVLLLRRGIGLSKPRGGRNRAPCRFPSLVALLKSIPGRISLFHGTSRRWVSLHHSVRNGVVVASRADEYQRRAQQCLEMAAAFRDREARIALSHMAEVWLRLAERKVPNQTQPVFQQQQQIQPKNDDKE